MSNWIGPMVRLVVCAANRYDDLLITGARHFDMVMIGQIKAICGKCEDITMVDKFRKSEQGFIDQFGVFMTREEAYEVALAAGQLNTRRSKSGPEGSTKLYSEDIY